MLTLLITIQVPRLQAHPAATGLSGRQRQDRARAGHQRDESALHGEREHAEVSGVLCVVCGSLLLHFFTFYPSLVVRFLSQTD